MKKSAAFALVALASEAVVSFAGPPPSKEVVPTPARPPSFFRGNEFDIGAFATYWNGASGNATDTRKIFLPAVPSRFSTEP